MRLRRRTSRFLGRGDELPRLAQASRLGGGVQPARVGSDKPRRAARRALRARDRGRWPAAARRVAAQPGCRAALAPAISLMPSDRSEWFQAWTRARAWDPSLTSQTRRRGVVVRRWWARGGVRGRWRAPVRRAG